MNRLLMAGLAVLLIVAGILAAQLGIISGSQGDLGDTLSESRIQSCQQIRDTICSTGETPTEEDYTDSCYSGGEHILESPYTCS